MTSNGAISRVRLSSSVFAGVAGDIKAQALNAEEINAKLIRQVIDQNEVL